MCESKRDLDLLVSGIGQFLVSGRRLLCEIATEDVEVARYVWAEERGYHHHVLA